jgi:CxxH/CxxC protein (TIGR04129 family)
MIHLVDAETARGPAIVYVVCEDHLEQALDEFVEIYEMPPDLYELESVSLSDWAAPTSCTFCSKPPKYLVV